MSTVYFLGAGASAADGLPVTSGLNYGVADWLRRRSKQAPELRALYRDLFQVRDSGLTSASRKWDEFLRKRDGDRAVGEGCDAPAPVAAHQPAGRRDGA